MVPGRKCQRYEIEVSSHLAGIFTTSLQAMSLTRRLGNWREQVILPGMQTRSTFVAQEDSAVRSYRITKLAVMRQETCI